MGLFDWLFGRTTLREFSPGRGWTIEVVGELQFQADLEKQYRLRGGTEHDVKVTAALIPEGNERDPNAVRVEIGGCTAGYLSRARALQYRAAISETAGQCSAKIVGGFILDDGTRAHFGMKLNLSWPPRFRA